MVARARSGHNRAAVRPEIRSEHLRRMPTDPARRLCRGQASSRAAARRRRACVSAVLRRSLRAPVSLRACAHGPRHRRSGGRRAGHAFESAAAPGDVPRRSAALHVAMRDLPPEIADWARKTRPPRSARRAARGFSRPAGRRRLVRVRPTAIPSASSSASSARAYPSRARSASAALRRRARVEVRRRVFGARDRDAADHRSRGGELVAGPSETRFQGSVRRNARAERALAASEAR